VQRAAAIGLIMMINPAASSTADAGAPTCTRCTHARGCCFGCCACLSSQLLQRLRGRATATRTSCSRSLPLEMAERSAADRAALRARAAAIVEASHPRGSAPRELPPRRLCVAPMMDWTDRRCRYFLRRFSKNTWLYTEMVTCSAILDNEWRKDQHLKFFEAEHPVALQLGGSDPALLAKCAAIGEGYGYDEINLNVGCPSDRVSRTKNSFGACLMATPELVARCVAEIKKVVSVPVTVKHRIGIDDMDSYENLHNFVRIVAEAGCSTFIVHARKAILKGKLTPKQNREIPALNYDYVYRLKRDFPHLEIIINGGVTDLAQAAEHVAQGVDGVMIGRSAYYDPFRILGTADRVMYGDASGFEKSRQQIVEEMAPFIQEQLEAGEHLNSVTRHMLGLFNACPGGKQYRQHLSEHVHLKGSGVHTLLDAVHKVPEPVRLVWGQLEDNKDTSDPDSVFMARPKEELKQAG